MRLCQAGGEGWSCDRSSERYSLTKGLCKTHYAQHRRGRDLAPIEPSRARAMSRGCSFVGCERGASAKGLCAAHYQQQTKGRPLTPLRKRRGNGAVQHMIRTGVVECLGCGEHKELSHYSTLNASGAPRPYCKPCNAERVRLRHYSVTKQFIDLLLQFQQGKCAVCGAAQRDGRAMDIDHDHVPLRPTGQTAPRSPGGSRRRRVLRHRRPSRVVPSSCRTWRRFCPAGRRCTGGRATWP